MAGIEQIRMLALAQSMSMPDGTRYAELHQRYANSIYGIHHTTQPPRFNQQYGYERSQMLKDLGDDIHPVRHMVHTEARITVPFITSQIIEGDQQFSADGIIALRAAALVHDIGETQHPDIENAVGAVVGDVWFEAKQQADSDQEVLIRRFLYDELYPDLDGALLDQVESIVENRDPFTGLAFNTIERIGYYKTAMLAGDLAIKLSTQEADNPSQRLIKLASLALRVSGNHRDILKERSELFPRAQSVLKSKAAQDEKIHLTLTEFSQDTITETA